MFKLLKPSHISGTVLLILQLYKCLHIIKTHVNGNFCGGPWPDVSPVYQVIQQTIKMSEAWCSDATDQILHPSPSPKITMFTEYNDSQPSSNIN